MDSEYRIDMSQIKLIKDSPDSKNVIKIGIVEAGNVDCPHVWHTAKGIVKDGEEEIQVIVFECRYDDCNRKEIHF